MGAHGRALPDGGAHQGRAGASERIGTRLDLLARRDQELRRLRRRRFSLRRLAVVVLVGLAQFVAVFALYRTPRVGEAIAVLITSALFGAVGLWSRSVARRASAAYEHWRVVDRTDEARALPAVGVLESGLATLWDAREAAEPWRFVNKEVQRATGGVNQLRAVAWMVPPVLGVSMGVALLVMGIASMVEDVPRPAVWNVAVFVLGGVLLILGSTFSFAGSAAELWRRQGWLNLLAVENLAYRRRAEALHPRAAPSATSPLAIAALAIVALLALLFLLLRLQDADPVLLVVAFGVLTILVVALRLVRAAARRSPRTLGLRAGTGSVLDVPGHRVELEHTVSGLHIRGARGQLSAVVIDRGSILALHTERVPTPVAGWCTKISTADDLIVLVGSRLPQDPALVALRQSVGAR